MPNLTYKGPSAASAEELLLRLHGAAGPIGCDIETVSLEDRRILGIGFALSPDEGYWFPIDSPWLPRTILQDSSYLKVFYNGYFDVPEMRKLGIEVRNYVDVYEALKILGHIGSLHDMARMFLGWDLVTVEDLLGPKGKGQLTMDKVPEEKVADKCIMDSRATVALWAIVAPRVNPEALSLEMSLIPKTLEISQRGMRIHRDRLAAYRKKYESDYLYLRTICEGMGFNPGSSRQVAAILQSRGHRIYYNKKTWNPKMGEEMLTQIYGDDPVAQLTLKYREVQTLLTHFFRNFELLIGADGRIHPKFVQSGALSGRYASTKPNAQNIPEHIRDMIIASEHKVLGNWDLNQIELRWLMFLSGDPEMARIFAIADTDPWNPEGDIHQGTATTLGISRRDSKDCNFAIVYGGDADTLYRRSGIEPDKGQRLLDHHRSVFTRAWDYLDELKEESRATGQMSTYMGRTRKENVLLDPWAPQYKKDAAVRELVNHKIQGSAGETLKRAMMQTWDAFTVDTIHDEELEEIDPGAQVVIPTRAIAPFNVMLKLKTGEDWKSMEELKRPLGRMVIHA